MGPGFEKMVKPTPPNSLYIWMCLSLFILEYGGQAAYMGIHPKSQSIIVLGIGLEKRLIQWLLAFLVLDFSVSKVMAYALCSLDLNFEDLYNIYGI